MRHDYSWQHRSIPNRMLSTEDTTLGVCLFLGKTWPLGHASTTDKCTVSRMDKLDKKKDCQTFARQDKRVLKIFLPLQIVRVTVGYSRP